MEDKTPEPKDILMPNNGYPVEVVQKAKAAADPSAVRSLVFESERQRNAQFIKKGLVKPGRVSFEVLRRASYSVAVARICITVLKEKVTKTKWVIQAKDPKIRAEGSDKYKKQIDQVTEFFKHPNGNDETFRTMLDKILEDLYVLDAVSLEKTRFPDGELAELHFIDAATIRPVYDEHGNQDIEIPIDTKADGMKDLPVSYVQIMNNSQYGGPESGEIVAAWPKKDFIYFHMHPQGAMESFGYGLSPLESVLSVVANLLNADNFNGTYFDEGAFPPIILQLVGQMTERDLEAFREYMYSELMGQFHRPAIFAGAQKAEVINLKDISNRDMQFMEYTQWLSRLMAGAFGLSAQDINITDDLNRATAETQKDLSEAKGYGSTLHLLKEVFNQEIIWKDFGFEDIEFDWIAEDATDKTTQGTIVDLALRNGTLTLNEAREKLGEMPYGDWADEPMLLSATGYVPLLAAENPNSESNMQDKSNEAQGEQQDKNHEHEDDQIGNERKYEDQGTKPDVKKMQKASDVKWDVFYDLVAQNGRVLLSGEYLEIFGNYSDSEGAIKATAERVLAAKHRTKGDKVIVQHVRRAEDSYLDGKLLGKSVFTPSGQFKCWMDDRGYSQPFIWKDSLTGQGYVIKPPVAVNLGSQDLEVQLTHQLAQMGLLVLPVTKMTMKNVIDSMPDEVKIEFHKYIEMTSEYDSEKWRAKFGAGHKFPYYLTSSYVDGFALSNPLLKTDMERDPEKYAMALQDLADLWRVEKDLVLGDRRADQYIIDHNFRAFGIDYQFRGDKERWARTKDSIQDALPEECKETFLTLTRKRAPTKKSIVKRLFGIKN